MEHLCTFTLIIARVSVAVIFLLNGAGIISQTLPARELAERHVPDRLIPLFMFAARTVEIVSGLALAVGLFPRYAAIALFAFILPATFVSHTFWSAKDGEEFQRQLRNFSTNAAIWGLCSLLLRHQRSLRSSKVLGSEWILIGREPLDVPGQSQGQSKL